MTSKPLRIAAALALLALVIVPLVLLRSCQSAGSAKTQATLSRGQTEAAIASGKDAVETIGNAATRETNITETVEGGTHAIAQAPAGNSNDAADRAACGMRSYRDLPRCRALLNPRAE